MRAPRKLMRKRNRRRVDPEVKKARVRGATRGFLRFVLRAFGAVFVVVAIFGAVFGVYVWATTSSTFAVTEVRIDGNYRARLDEVAPLTGISSGMNIFLVDTRAAEHGVAGHPWIRSAVVRREPPNRVLIALREYEPAAIVALGSLYVADDEGTLFKQAVPGDGVDLPIISGIATDEGDSHVGAQIRRGVDLIGRWEASELSSTLDLAQVHLNPLRGATLTVVRPEEEAPPFIVHLAAGDIDARLSRLSSLLHVLSERGERPKEVFLDNRARPQWVVARVEE